MALRIEGLATALPAGAIDQPDAAAEAVHYCAGNTQQANRLQRFYARSGVQQRRSVLLSTEPIDGHAPPKQNGHPERVREADDATDALQAEETAKSASYATVPDAGKTDIRHVGVQPAAPLSTLAFFPLPDDAADRGPTVRERMAAYREHALPLAQQAADRALHQANVAPDQVSQLITVSCTGFSAPGLDVQLIDALGLPADVGRTMIGFMGCHGALNGLRVAKGLARDSDGFVLLCAVELCSLHFQYGWAADQVLANALFADGAAALVACPASSEPGEETLHANHADSSRKTVFTCSNALSKGAGNLETDGESSDLTRTLWHVLDTRSRLLPDSREAMQWHIGEHGFEMRLSQRVPALIEQHLSPWLADWLGEHELAFQDIAHWAIHPGGPRVISAVEQALALPCGAGDLSREILAAYGNMSSPTVLFILERLAQRPYQGPCLALGFGPGLMVEAALLRGHV